MIFTNINVFWSFTKRSVYKKVKFGEKLFQFLSRLSHKVCRFLSSPYDGVMLEPTESILVYMHYVAVNYIIVLGLGIIVVFFVTSLETCFSLSIQ